jgi:hypothetical protein
LGAVGDPLEHEADTVAERVMRMPNPVVPMPQTHGQPRRKCAACEGEQLSRAPLNGCASETASAEAPPSVFEVLRSPGQPLALESRRFFEPRFCHDFMYGRPLQCKGWIRNDFVPVGCKPLSGLDGAAHIAAILVREGVDCAQSQAVFKAARQLAQAISSESA